MGHRKIPVIHTLDLGKKYPELEVRMTGLRLGEMRKVMRAMGEDTKTDEMIDVIVKAVGDHLVSWTLEDAEGNPLEPSLTEIEDLELEMLMTICEEWIGLVADVSPDLGKDLPSGEQFPGQPVTMEAL